MPQLNLRPRTESLLRAWKSMIQQNAKGVGYDLAQPRQEVFCKRVEEFRTTPTAENFDAIWTPKSAVEHSNPGGQILRTTFDGDVDELVEFIDSVESADQYNHHWENRFSWSWALWELYTRLNKSIPVVLTEQSAGAMGWLGAKPSGDFHTRMETLEAFRDQYTTVIGHPTEGYSHETSVKIELDELFRALQTVDKEGIASQVKGQHGDFYRSLYGGSESAQTDTNDRVELVDIGTVVRAYAYGEANDAYDKNSLSEYWGGEYWENWKESYAEHVRTEIREEFTLDDLSPDEIGPLFEAITTAEGSSLSKPVATYVMGSQWGQYTWNDIVNHFTENPVEASQALSVFFDDSRPVVNRLDAFKEHTIHLKETEDRSPGSIQRMATSLLMFTNPTDHLGLAPARTKEFLTDKSTLSNYKSAFQPQQYRKIIGPLRELRDEIEYQLREYGSDNTVTMLDVHSMIWIYGGEGEPEPHQLPDT